MTANDGYTGRLFALAFTDRCLEQVKVKHYARTAQVKKIRTMMHEIMYETVAEPAMRVVVQAGLSLYASDLFTGIVMGKRKRCLAHRAHLRELLVAERVPAPRPCGPRPHGASSSSSAKALRRITAS